MRQNPQNTLVKNRSFVSFEGIPPVPAHGLASVGDCRRSGLPTKPFRRADEAVLKQARAITVPIV
jgi:hypothetical protein